jgi:tetratricopeptide (TPR) repeat protein
MATGTDEYEQAIDVFRYIGEVYPEFRSEERQMLMGRCLAYLGQQEPALMAFSEAQRLDPLLVTSYDYMWGKFTSLDADAGTKALNQWRANRWAGVDHPEQNLIEQ